jgi:hypothetical protein
MQESKERIQSKISQLRTFSNSVKIQDQWTKDWAVQTFKFCDNPGKVKQGLESQTPPYLSNGDRLGKYFCTTQFKTFENGGVGHFQIPKKKSKLGQSAHVTQKPQIFNILQTLHF